MKTIVFATKRFEYLAEEMASRSSGRIRQGALANSTFPNGERRLEVSDFSEARNSHVLLIGGTEADDFFDLQMYAGELAQVSQRLTILIPFFRYATQERKDDGRDGHIIIAKGVARALSSLPQAVGGTSIILVDPHTETLAQYFDDTRVRTEIIRCGPLLKSEIRARFGNRLDSLVLGSVDGSRSQLLKQLEEALAVPISWILKERTSGSETQVVGSENIDAVKGKIVLMVDDMARTLGSAATAAGAYRQAGAKEVWLLVTHADYSPEALSSARDEGLLNGVITSNSYPSHAMADGTFAHVFSITDHLLAEFTERLRF